MGNRQYFKRGRARRHGPGQHPHRVQACGRRLDQGSALEFAKQNIPNYLVAPAGVATDMVDRFAGNESDMRDYFTSLHPVGRIGASEEIAAAVLYLCSDNAKFTTGTSLVVDARQSLAQ